HHPKTENIDPRIHPLSPRLLRRHVTRRPHHHSRISSVPGEYRSLRTNGGQRRLGQLCQSEVEHFHNSVSPHHHILRFHVPVDHPCPLRRGQPRRGLARL